MTSIMKAVPVSSSQTSLRERLQGLVNRFSLGRVLVAGDVIADQFIYGEVSRVSREAPVLILKYDATEMVPGGAGNAANNVAALSGRASLAGIVGADAEGRRLTAGLVRGVDRSLILRIRGYRTPIKTRILAGGIHSPKQQVVRIDREIASPRAASALRAFEARLRRALSHCDAVILSDYGSGLITPALARMVRAVLARRSKRHIPVLIDSRYRLLDYRHQTLCTPNEAEVEHLLGVRIDDNRRVLERAGREILRRTRSLAVLVTRGSRGMALFEPGRTPELISIFGSDEVADVTGAGDTVIATVALALTAGATFGEAARLANYAGGLVVMKRGTATVSVRELRAAINSDLKDVR
jgi:rfaE bifunctional protein kinase chain/domain